jgi:hypothetical protein
VDFYRDIGSLLERLRELEMWAQVQVEGDQLVDLKPLLLDSGVRLLTIAGGLSQRQAWDRQVSSNCLHSPKRDAPV